MTRIRYFVPGSLCCDCMNPHSAGCGADPDCEDLVCLYGDSRFDYNPDPYCCYTYWDSTCAGYGVSVCTLWCEIPTQDLPANSQIVESACPALGELDSECALECVDGYSLVEGSMVPYTCQQTDTVSGYETVAQYLGGAITCASTCTATEVDNSDKSEYASITGVTGDSVYVTCDVGYSGGGWTICESNGSFSSVVCTGITES